MDGLTKSNTERQDLVDNACHKFLNDLATAIMGDSGRDRIAWDMEHISAVREAAQEVIVDKLHLMTEMVFYPFVEDIVTDPNFWDCECRSSYIHPNSEESCPVCQARRDDQPDSRVNEIVDAIRGKYANR